LGERKVIKTSSGEVNIQVPRDRDGRFELKLLPKRKKMFQGLNLSMYVRGMF